MRKVLNKYLYIYILLSGITFLLFFYILHTPKLEKADYIFFNYILLSISIIFDSINKVRIYNQNYIKKFSNETFFFLILIIQVGILFISQPGIYYLTQNFTDKFQFFSLTPFILSVVPFVILKTTNFICIKIVKSYQVWLEESRDIIEGNFLSILSYEFIGGLFTNSFVLHIFILNYLIDKL